MSNCHYFIVKNVTFFLQFALLYYKKNKERKTLVVN